MYGISNSQQQGGGGGSITYAKLSGDVEFSSTSPSASSAFFVNTDAANWAVNETMGRKALTNTSDLGLVIGNSYTMDVNIDGTSYTFSGTAEDGTNSGLSGVKILGLVNESKGGFSIFDHCDFSAGYPKADNGAIIFSGLSSTPTSVMITNFSGGLKIVSPATITNSAIKVNSSVTMYINSSLVVSGTKTDGSITLNANNGGAVFYEMEILDVPTEGLFEIINGYVPEITLPTVPQWHTVYEDTTGTGVTSIDNLPEPLKGGELYRITIEGDFYIFCLHHDGDNVVREENIVVEQLNAGNNSLTHNTMSLVYHERYLSLAYELYYNITDAGISNYDFSTAPGIKFTKLEVYR